jgi:hypothetical protein
VRDVVMRFEDAKDGDVVWCVDERWAYEPSPVSRLKALVCTSSWQRLASAGVTAGHKHVIVPAVNTPPHDLGRFDDLSGDVTVSRPATRATAAS